MPRLERDPAVVAAFLSDAARVPGGFADGVVFPATIEHVAAAVRRARSVLPIGAQSSLTGGATPRGETILSTRALTSVDIRPPDRVRVGAGVALSNLQRLLDEHGLYYPPIPTFDGAFAGGTIATNAAGAATFKYGSTRPWVMAITIVLADGDVLELTRGAVFAAPPQGTSAPHLRQQFLIERVTGEATTVPVPGYIMPAVPKLSAGYYARPGMDLIDLFIGSEGTLGIIVDATLRVIPKPDRIVALVTCGDDAEAIALNAALRADAHAAWRGERTLDVAAIEYIDARALQFLDNAVFARAAVPRPSGGRSMMVLQIETGAEGEAAALERLQAVLDEQGVRSDAVIASINDSRAAQRLFELREAVPAAVNAHVAAAQRSTDPRIEKTAGDLIVPVNRLGEAMAAYRLICEERGLEYAIWGHLSDGNLHPNVIPRSFADVERGREAIIEMARAAVRLGGAPLAEHGVGRSAMKQLLLRELYGETGIEAMRAVKRALDPQWKLAPGVLFPA